MKIAFVADVHIANHRKWGGPVNAGLNRRAYECVQTLERAVRAAAQVGAHAFFVLGDLFDHARPAPQLIRATADALCCTDLPVYILLGNHDLQSTDGHDHACAAFELSTAVTPIRVIEKAESIMLEHEGEHTEVICVPYRPGIASEWLPAELSALGLTWGNSHVRTLFTHVGIWDDETPSYMRSAHDAVGLGQVRWLMDAYNISGAFAGNWHQPRAWKGHNAETTIGIPGTVCPHSFSDEGIIGRTGLWDTETLIYVASLVPGPRFHKVSVRDVESLIEKTGGLFYIRITVGDDAEVDTYLNIAERLLTNSQVSAFEMEDVRVVEADLAASVRAARRDPDEVIRAEMKVEEPGTLDGALARLKAYRDEASR